MIKGTHHTEETKNLIKLRVAAAVENGYKGGPHTEERKENIKHAMKLWWRKRRGR